MDGGIPPLFRPEVLASQRSRHLGGILIHQPWSHSVAALLAVAFIDTWEEELLEQLKLKGAASASAPLPASAEQPARNGNAYC
ncbi:MAG: hypothetical protein WC247_13890 [Porticoccaceae bacterium]